MERIDERQTTIGPAALAQPRLNIRRDRMGRGLLDGGWWPRTAGPAAELRELIPTLDERHGPITRIMLGTADWDKLLDAGADSNREALAARSTTLAHSSMSSCAVSPSDASAHRCVMASAGSGSTRAQLPSGSITRTPSVVSIS